ncbi:MAG: matrixin family metalloprotease [Pirellulales bacterium]
MSSRFAFHRLVRYTLLWVVIGLVYFTMPVTIFAKVVVLANRTPTPVTVTALPVGEPPRKVTINPGDARPIYFEQQLQIRYPSKRPTSTDAHSRSRSNTPFRFGTDNSKEKDPHAQEHSLKDASAYYFGLSSENKLVFEEIGLGGSRRQAPRRPIAKEQKRFFPAGDKANTIPVKILVDEDEKSHRRVWESRLRKRVENASRVLAVHCGIRFQVVAVDTWDSDNGQNDFFQSLRELEREVYPKPGQLAIGFSSQYRIARSRIHMGGTRGALHSHILLKERSPNVRETERLELLVHELGHFLGASHSPEPTSVMRPVLSGGLQRRVNAHIRFDPVNTLLIAMMGEEIREHRVKKLSDLSLSTKRRMQEVQSVLVKALPDDPAAGHYVQLLGMATTGPLLTETSKILQQLLHVAKQSNKADSGQRKAERDENGEVLGPGNGDLLTEVYVREAALAAQQARSEYAETAFLLALGIAMDDTDLLRSLPWIEPILRRVETDAQRRARAQVFGKPTMRGRRDLTRHFFVSALSVAFHGSRATRGAGIAKELFDAQGGRGFSFKDMAANRSGIAFAVAVLGKKIPLTTVATDFQVDAFLPTLEGLTENLSPSQWKQDYGGYSDERFTEQLRHIDRRVMELPIYQQSRRSGKKK